MSSLHISRALISNNRSGQHFKKKNKGDGDHPPICELKDFDEFARIPGGKNCIDLCDEVDIHENVKSHLLENRNWSWSYMEKQLRQRNLESLYLRYRQILHQGYFSVFLILQVCITIIHVVCLLVKEVNDPQHRSLLDIVSYVFITVLLWPLVAVVFNKRLVKKYPRLPYMASCFAIGIIVSVDIALPLYHTSAFHSRIPLRPAYTTHALLACYVFLPLTNNITPIVLGSGITLTHLFTLVMITYRNSFFFGKQIASETVFFLCLNGMGLYYRLIKEMVIRRAFLDRRACVEFTMKLNYEKEQEEQLLLSILPWHIAARVREDIRKKSLQFNKVGKTITTKPFKELYIEKHDNVSILYADVVNYTKMTSSLPVNKLVETLNELFGKFDEASEKRKVLRIKFLGDCYYCAAGIPQPNPEHAKCCVDLGLDMIAIIKELRTERKLDIDMRIGVHSGSILSGLLGRCKWQYDIWSKDVVIANRMEQSGKPGMVHITETTLKLLGDHDYIVEQGKGHERDELLAKYQVQTFLVIPREEEFEPTKAKSSKFSKDEFKATGMKEPNSKNLLFRHGSDAGHNFPGMISEEKGAAYSRRRTTFMSNNLILYQQRLKMADVYMEKAINNLPLGKWKYYKSRLYPLYVTFREECSWQVPFMKQPDPLFKFYITSALFVSFGICAMHVWQPARWYLISWASFAFCTVGLISFFPLTWTHYIWNAIKDPKHRMKKIPAPEHKLLLFLYKTSVKIIWSWSLRTFLYIIVCVLLSLCSLADLTVQVYDNEANVKKSSDANNEKIQNHSLWQTTESCYLAILMSFFFTRIHFRLKLLIGIIILVTYSVGISMTNIEYSGETWNPNLEPKTAHILSLVFLVLELHIMDLQAECMDRLDYLWKKQLGNEKDEAEKTRSVNLILLHNILPKHVAKVYLNTNRASNDLYHENYDCVAVMFASLVNYDLYHEKEGNQLEIKSLEILNKMICDFDDALFESRFKTVEKIKVAGATYMAACGLQPGQKDANSLNRLGSSKLVLILVEFAATVFRRLQKINREFNTDFKLRIGISHGPVTAGVVGSQKPLYDVWGNAVNVASRMDSTGEPDKIQVTSSTAAILQHEGIPCSFRGPTFVKGKGIIDTYFVNLTDHFYLARQRQI